jgi:hypothetical protein
MSSTPEATALRVGITQTRWPGERAGFETFAALGAGVDHVVDTAGQGFFEPGVVHGRTQRSVVE